jgi:hypothetical protein
MTSLLVDLSLVTFKNTENFKVNLKKKLTTFFQLHNLRVG